jgi:hypothetical protein
MFEACIEKMTGMSRSLPPDSRVGAAGLEAHRASTLAPNSKPIFPPMTLVTLPMSVPDGRGNRWMASLFQGLQRWRIGLLREEYAII